MGSEYPRSTRPSIQSTRHWLRAAAAEISHRRGSPSQMRSSTVPKSGWGRMSHHTSRIEVMAFDDTSVVISCSNSLQPASWYGSPAVGSASNTFERLEDRPVSLPFQNGLEADRARKWGM